MSDFIVTTLSYALLFCIMAVALLGFAMLMYVGFVHAVAGDTATQKVIGACVMALSFIPLGVMLAVVGWMLEAGLIGG